MLPLPVCLLCEEEPRTWVIEVPMDEALFQVAFVDRAEVRREVR